LRGSARRRGIIVLIVFPIFAMFFDVLLRNGWMEQLGTTQRRAEVRTTECGEKQRGTIPALKADRPGWSARANCRKRGAANKNFIIGAILE
jgi:hypothetical protein